MSTNIVRARVSIRGTRPLLQHAFGPESLPLEKQEKVGKTAPGNVPSEWRKTCMVTGSGQLYIRGTYVFGCVRDGSKHTKKGKGSIQAIVAATLQVEEAVILIDRFLPKECLPVDKGAEPTRDPTAQVYLDVAGVRNPSTKARNVRYRLACAPGWGCTFTLLWDKTLVDRNTMRSVLNDASVLVGLGDGRSVGTGRFEILKFEVLTDAEETAAEGSLGEAQGNRVEPGQEGMRPMPQAAGANGSAHRSPAKRKARDKQTVEP